MKHMKWFKQTGALAFSWTVRYFDALEGRLTKDDAMVSGLFSLPGPPLAGRMDEVNTFKKFKRQY